MKFFMDCPPDTLRDIRFVLCDIDDTLSWQGRLPAVAYDALERLRNAGLIVIPVTGRPGGWCDHIARMWPVNGVVGENGAFYFHYREAEKRMIRHYWRTLLQRVDDRIKLDALAQKIPVQVPGSQVSSDQAYREADLAIDFCEDVVALPDTSIAQIVSAFEHAGATAKVSSIHVNGWFGDYDKLSMSKRMLHDVFGLPAEQIAQVCAFVGDSPNDCPMFEFFPTSIGVSNIADFASQLSHPPSWITDKPGGFGFAEFADHLLTTRQSR